MRHFSKYDLSTGERVYIERVNRKSDFSSEKLKTNQKPKRRLIQDEDEKLMHNHHSGKKILLQAISEEAVDTSYVAYIETKCKLQDSYDQDVAKCLEIIFDSVVYDVAFVADIGGMRQLMSDLVAAGSNIYASQFKKKEKKAAVEMKDIKSKYESHID